MTMDVAAEIERLRSTYARQLATIAGLTRDLAAASLRVQQQFEELRAMRVENARLREALRRLERINCGPDQASAEWRCLEAAAIAREALKK